MIYKADIDSLPLYRNVDELNLIDPKLNLEVNKSGSFSFKMSPSHPRFNDIKLMKSEITIFQNDVEIWRGRPIRIEEDFYKNKSIECEGELAYLNDIIQPPKQYKNYTPESFFSALIAEYNKRCDSKNKFYIGTVTVTDKNDTILRYTNWENTIECINDKLIKQFGGYLRIRHSSNRRYIDYLKEIENTNDQVIRFGANIVDFSTNFDVTDIATAIIPLGARQDTKDIEALEKYLTIEKVNANRNYLSNSKAVELYGWIEKTVHWDDVTIADNLKTKGQKYLTDYQFDTMQLELTAVDMANLNANYESIKLLQNVRVVSEPHGMDKMFPVTKLNISLDNPAADTFTLGLEVSKSLTAKSSELNSNIKSKLDETATISSVHQEAINTATDLIKTGVDGGYVKTSTSEILIMDNPDKDKAKGVWRFNKNGLGYSKNGYNGTYGTAITMNGQIVADYVTTGTMSADRIKGGTLTLGGSGYNVNGKITVRDKNDTIIANIDRNGINAQRGRIGTWSIRNGYLQSTHSVDGQSVQIILGGKTGGTKKSGPMVIGSLNETINYYIWNMLANGYTSGLTLNAPTIKVSNDSNSYNISLREYIKRVAKGEL
jgi:phage minor structural protein